MSKRSQIIDCRSEVGETVALIDAAITTLRLAAQRRPFGPEVEAALRDLQEDEAIIGLLDMPKVRPPSPEDERAMEVIRGAAELLERKAGAPDRSPNAE